MAANPGTSQSPINFREKEITFVDRLPRIDFCYPQSTDLTLVNTGSPDEFATIRADVPADAAYITLSGVRYDLEQFHWHTRSEHEIEGRDTPLEMHFVHRPADRSFLVLAVFIKRGRANSAIDPIFRELPERHGGTHIVSGVRLMPLLPDGRESFRYSGSLTTPPFTEPVPFIVLAHSITLSGRQIDAFRELFEDGNSREVQPLNDREVLSDAEDIFDDDD
jgi:carbonic anhydrase